MQADDTYIASSLSVADAIFTDIRHARPAAVSDKQWLSLELLFGSTLDKAVQIVDQDAIACFVGQPSQRRLCVVKGRTGGDSYIVFPAHYCSCKAFRFDIVGKAEGLLCKHQLAAQLVEALQRSTPELVDDMLLAEMLLAA